MDDFLDNNNGYNNGNYNSNGYNNGYNNGSYGSGYNNNGGGYYPDGRFTGAYGEPPQGFKEKKKASGLAIASFVISLVNLILCCTSLSFIACPLCILFSIIALVKKKGGVPFAVIGMVISVISLIIFCFYGFIMMKIMPDAFYFFENQQQITEDFDRDGTIPERFEKYRDPKYDKYWESKNYSSFDEFFEHEIIDKYRSNLNNNSVSYKGRNSTDISLVLQPAMLL